MNATEKMIQENAVKAYRFLVSKGLSHEDAKMAAMSIMKEAVKKVSCI